MEIKPLFAEFFVEDTLDIDHESIVDLVYRKKKDAKLDSVYFDGSEPEMTLFYDNVNTKLNAMHEALGLTKTLKQSLYMAWANVNRNEFITAPHSHTERPYAVISGVYYPKAEGDANPIEFMNNNSAVESVMYYDLLESENVFNTSVRRIQPTTGKVIFFPSWMKHYVAQTGEMKEDRISLAFNAEMVPV